MTRAAITLSAVGDFVSASSIGETVTLNIGDDGISLAVLFPEEATARRFASAVEFARTGPEHSVLTIATALAEAARLSQAVAHDATGGVDYRFAGVEIAGETFDLQVLAHNLAVASRAAFSAVADMDSVLSKIAASDEVPEVLRSEAGSCLVRARRPKRDGQQELFGDRP